MGKWLLIGLRQRLIKMSLQHPVVPESKEVLKTQKHKKLGMLKKNRSQPKRTINGQTWSTSGNKINKIVIDYNPKYKINSQESTTEQTKNI